MFFNWISTASFVALNKRGVKTCFNSIIGNTKLIQHRFIKSFLSSLVESAILKKDKGRLHLALEAKFES